MNTNDALVPLLDELEVALQTLTERFLPGPDEQDLMLRYHMGWVNREGLPVDGFGGKRFRPLLLLLCNANANGDWHQALPAATSVELIHSFSLIHDDIMDDSPLRRGRSALWRLWGISKAINAGDALFSIAHLALWTLLEERIPVGRVVESWHILEETNLALTRGQFMDMQFEKMNHIAVRNYVEMIKGKSAELVAASAQLGALLAGASEEDILRYREFGMNLGVAFQIRDDILGIWGDPEVTGKSAATDLLARKKSLPVLYALASNADFGRLYLNERSEHVDLSVLLAFLDEAGSHEYAVSQEQYYADLALESLDSVLGDSDFSRVLRSLVLQYLGRSL